MTIRTKNSTSSNIISNLIARVWSIGIGIILIPIYADILGMEAYGLIGFYGTLLSSLAILDLGLSATLNREMARSLALNTSAENIRNLVFSLECIYWVVGVGLGILVVLLAPFIATNWVNAEEMSTSQISTSIMLMGGIISFQWSQSIYAGGLMGLQRQVSYNIANVILSTIKSVGVIGILYFVSPRVEVFFLWQMLIGFITPIVLRYLLWKYLPISSKKIHFDRYELKKIWRFAAGMTGISLATFCLAQIDKIILSKVLSLQDYGYYTMAWTLGTSVLLVVGILGAALLPKITETVTKGNEEQIVKEYHRYMHLVVSAVSPIAITLFFFSKEILFLWTNSEVTSDKIWLAVTILAAGSVCNAFMHIPYYTMLAKGITKFTIYQNIIASVILTPLLFFCTTRWGITGATIVWLFVNFGYNIISLPMIHKLYLPQINMSKVYLRDIGMPLFLSILIIGGIKYVSTLELFIPNWFYVLSAIGLTYLTIILSSNEYIQILKIARHKLRLKYGK